MKTQNAPGTLAAIAFGLALALIPHPAGGASVLLNPPSGWNGFFFSADIQSGFHESGGVGIVEVKKSTVMLVGPSPDVVPGLVLNSTPISAIQMPTSGNPKDVASGELRFSYTVGLADASANDHFGFSLTNTTSASHALVDFGSGPVPADAYFHASLKLVTMGPIGPAIGAVFGLPDMPSLNSPTESMTAGATKGPWSAPAELVSLLPGDTGVEVALTMTSWADQFTYYFTYDIVTPYGTDPTYSYALGGVAGVAAIPEPSTARLSTLALVFGGLLLRRRGMASL